MTKKHQKTATEVASEDRRVFTEFEKRPNRALAPAEVAILTGPVDFSIETVFERLVEAGKLCPCPAERHMTGTDGDEQTFEIRHRLVR